MLRLLLMFRQLNEHEDLDICFSCGPLLVGFTFFRTVIWPALMLM